jgi:hypothetical protein
MRNIYQKMLHKTHSITMDYRAHLRKIDVALIVASNNFYLIKVLFFQENLLK